jgi:hypothetical protein
VEVGTDLWFYGQGAGRYIELVLPPFLTKEGGLRGMVGHQVPLGGGKGGKRRTKVIV